MKVAVCRSLQHSCKLGHFASSQTVFNRFSRINIVSFLYESFVLMLIFKQVGFLSIVFVLLFDIVTLFHSLYFCSLVCSMYSMLISCNTNESRLSIKRQ